MMFVSDLDDTLFREIDYVRSGYRAIASEIEKAGLMSASEVVNFLESSVSSAKGFDDLAAQIWQKHPASPFTVERMVDIYRYHKPDIRLRPGAFVTLEKMRKSNIPMGIITDGRSVTQRAKIEALGLDKFISDNNIIISEEIGCDKTRHLPFRIMMERNPEEQSFLYLGDNPAKDFRWPNAMGWETVELIDERGTNVHSQDIDVPSSYRARHHIKSISHVLRYLC